MSKPNSKVTASGLVEHFFRHESGKLIASLVRFFGLRHFDLIEDMVQSALAEALLAWKQNGVPPNPSAWIHRVAKNRVLDSLRRARNFERIAQEVASGGQPELAVEIDERDVQDSLLSMLFTCCHPELQAEASIPLTLKSVCGFGEKEISKCLLVPVPTLRKRIYRAKRFLIQRDISLELPRGEELLSRLRLVHNVLYLMFNEGYASSVADESIRMDICEEAARLCHLLTENDLCNTGTSSALLSLMLFHASRFHARLDHEGALVLLEDQDRQLWDRKLISRAMDYFKHASRDDVLSNYHLEAAIAMYHCAARRFQDTNWEAIIALYDRLIASSPSPIYQLNRAIALGQRDGPPAALAVLHDLRSDPRLASFHLLDAAFGEFYRKSDEKVKAKSYFVSALQKTSCAAERSLLQKRMLLCEPS